MLTAVKNNINFLWQSIKTNVKCAAEYKLSFVIQSIFMFINNGFFLVFWLVIFNINDGSINTVDMGDILYIWSIPTISYGVAYFVFGGVQNINTNIISGAMDSYLLQPKNVLFNVMTSKCVFSAFGDLLYGLVIGFVATGGNIPKYIMLVIFGVFGSVFYLSTDILVRSLSVWLKDTERISHIYTHSLLTTFSIYPEEIFSKGVKLLLYTVIPVGYIAYLPKQIIESFDFKKVLLVLIVGIIYMGLAIIVFNKAMKRYESGNNISMKM